MGVEFTANASNRDVGMTTDELKSALDMADLYGTKYIKKAEITWRGRLLGLTFTNSTAHIRVKAQLRTPESYANRLDPDGAQMTRDAFLAKTDEEIDEEFRDQ
jgi:hypothetical protein